MFMYYRFTQFLPNSLFKKSSFYFYGAIFLVFFGLLSLIGWILNIGFINSVGIASMASPFPTPFAQEEPYVLKKYQINFYNDGPRKVHLSSPEFYSQINGPHMRKIVYVNMIGNFRDNKYEDKIILFFCNNSEFNNILPNHLHNFTITMQLVKYNGEVNYETNKQFFC